MQTPLVSIIIPNYNHARFLKQRIESVLIQTVQDFEIILLDDCSTDNSKEILGQYKNHPKITQTVFNTKNSGSPFKQWQKGIDLAKGNYIWIAESDDYCQANFLEEVFNCFNDNRALGVVYTQSVDVDENGRLLSHRSQYTKEFIPNVWSDNFAIEGHQFIENYLSYKNVIPNASAVVFKKELLHTNVFTTQLLQMRMCGDWLFWIKLCLRTDIGFIAKDLNCFRNHSAVTRNHSNSDKKKLRLLEEKTIRTVLESHHHSNTKLTSMLYKKWFRLHSKKEVLLPSFYAIKLKKTAIFSFLSQVKAYYIKF